MFGKLTKVKIIILIGLLVGLLFKGQDLIHYLQPYDETKPGENTKVLVKEDKPPIEAQTDSAVSKISIIITNLGLQKEGLSLAKLTDKKISFGISTYCDNLGMIAKSSLEDNRGTAILLPTQSINSSTNDPGSNALLKSSSLSENTKRFKSLLTKLVSKDIGIYIADNSIFSLRKEDALTIVNLLEDNSDSFKFFLYYDKDSGNALTNALKTSNISTKVIMINNIIDSSLVEEDIIHSLDGLAELSLKNKSVAVGSISPTKISLETMNKWLKANQAKVELVSLIDLIHESNE